MIHDKKDNSGKLQKLSLSMKEHSILERFPISKPETNDNKVDFIFCDPPEVIIYSKINNINFYIRH
jgi:hypothetical protein